MNGTMRRRAAKRSDPWDLAAGERNLAPPQPPPQGEDIPARKKRRVGERDDSDDGDSEDDEDGLLEAKANAGTAASRAKGRDDDDDDDDDSDDDDEEEEDSLPVGRFDNRITSSSDGEDDSRAYGYGGPGGVYGYGGNAKPLGNACGYGDDDDDDVVTIEVPVCQRRHPLT
jgi:hypothetical protein